MDLNCPILTNILSYAFFKKSFFRGTRLAAWLVVILQYPQVASPYCCGLAGLRKREKLVSKDHVLIMLGVSCISKWTAFMEMGIAALELLLMLLSIATASVNLYCYLHNITQLLISPNTLPYLYVVLMS